MDDIDGFYRYLTHDDYKKYYNQGDGLFVCGNRRMRIQVIATQEELDFFGSGGGY